MPSDKHSLADRLYRSLLRLLPADFRGEFGGEMEAAFHEQSEETRRHGLAALLKMWWDTIVDLFGMAPREHLSVLVSDARFAARMMAKNPGYTLATIAILGLGIGANTAIFSVVNSVLLNPLPYIQGDQLVVIRQPSVKLSVDDEGFSAPELNDYRRQNRSLSGLAEYHSMTFTLYGKDEANRVRTGVVSPEFFELLGVKPLLGRTFAPDDNRAGAQPVLVLSYEFWRQVEGGNPNIVGKTYQMNDKPHVVIGVLPAIPQYPQENDVYMPASACPFRSSPMMANDRSMRMLNLFGRLKPGETAEHCQSDLSAIANRLQHDYPESFPKGAGLTVTASILREDLVKKARPLLLLLMGAAAFVLLIACANVANLILARMARREQELMIRTAMGAGSARLLRQLLTESSIQALLAAGVGLLVASTSLHLLTDFASQITPRAREIAINGRVLAFTILCAGFTSIVFGSVAALYSRQDVSSGLKEGGHVSPERSRKTLRSALIAAQIAFSYVLLIGAGLMTRSFVQLSRVDPGFVPQRVLTASIDLDWSRFTTDEQHASLSKRILETFEGQPGIASAAISSSFPLDPDNALLQGQPDHFRVEGDPRSDSESPPISSTRSATPGYFKTLGIPLIAGRGFQDSDDAKAPGVTLINHALAAKYWDTQDPIGKRMSINGGKHWMTIVGVVGDVKEFGLNLDTPYQIFMPNAQSPRIGCLLIRAIGDPAQMVNQVRRSLHQVEPLMSITRIETMEEARSGSMSSPRTLTQMFGMFAALALLIAVAGIWSMLALWLRQRMREIGIRMVLGASSQNIVAAILRQGMTLVVAGVMAGLLVAPIVTQLLGELLFQVKPIDIPTYMLVTVILFVAALLACYIPARRASRINPQFALRYE